MTAVTLTSVMLCVASSTWAKLPLPSVTASIVYRPMHWIFLPIARASTHNAAWDLRRSTGGGGGYASSTADGVVDCRSFRRPRTAAAAGVRGRRGSGGPVDRDDGRRASGGGDPGGWRRTVAATSTSHRGPRALETGRRANRNRKRKQQLRYSYNYRNSASRRRRQERQQRQSSRTSLGDRRSGR